MSRSTALTLLVGFLALLATAAILVIVIRAPSTADELTLIGAVIAFLAPLVTSIVALLRAETANHTAVAAKEIVAEHVNNDGKTTTSPTPGV